MTVVNHCKPFGIIVKKHLLPLKEIEDFLQEYSPIYEYVHIYNLIGIFY